ncbi:DUF2164 domain-containing protein [Pseudorhodoferax sp. Leaf267]|uniref:DUF2164 domain-containing protein n=1 Tax=Pseudorhodoferax sp. Leaf267 TaxID=1736316 RepID=UPI0006F5F80C|nr:DUF2164 domain-containing protein [Pseudorhodoferax sp. Leaf267]KQP21815.1 hypothetical protein ASF43_26075 [Pseudorhodoferax sp. Leaf267]
MPIALPRDKQQQALASLERYLREHMDEPIGNIAAAQLLNFFIEEIGPSLYNQAVADAQERMQLRVSELDIEVHADEFGYWNKKSRQGR